MLKKIFLVILFVFGSVALTAISAEPAFAKKDEVYTSFRNNFGAGGYDVISFHAGNPSKGNVNYITSYNGAEWMFVNQVNLDMFLENPKKYIPAYGGYCAWAIANNKLAKGSPKHWSIENGVLYLNFNKRIKDTWVGDKEKFIKDGNAAWPVILD